jgi:hypothetical protein
LRKEYPQASLTYVNSILHAPDHAAHNRQIVGDAPSGSVAQCLLKSGTFLMAIHKKILEWQAAHPNITWIGWGIVWAIVLSLLFWPSKGLR